MKLISKNKRIIKMSQKVLYQVQVNMFIIDQLTKILKTEIAQFHK